MSDYLEEQESDFEKKWKKVVILIGCVGFLGLSILGGIHIAFLFPQFALVFCIVAFFVTCAVHASSYAYYVSHKNSRSFDTNADLNTWESKLFLCIGELFILAELPIKFSGIYIGFSVLASSLPFHIPLLVLTIFGVVFGTAAALSGFFLHTKALLGLIVKFNTRNKMLKLERQGLDRVRSQDIRTERVNGSLPKSKLKEAQELDSAQNMLPCYSINNKTESQSNL